MELEAQKLGVELRESDACRAAKALVKAYPDARTAFLESASGKVLLGTGGTEDFACCLEANTSQAVPYLQLEDDLIWFVNWQDKLVNNRREKHDG